MAKHTIKLKKYLNVIEEYAAAAVITPGELLELTSAGTVQAHSVEGGNVLPMFALEDELQGKGIDDDYASGDRVQCWIPTRGDVVNAILEDGETISIGEAVESNGTGYVQAHAVDTYDSDDAGSIYGNQIVGISLEALDLSGSSGEGSAGESSVGTLGYNKRLQIRIV